MKILHIVTYISKDSEFGGPSQVAQNICTELNKNENCEILALSDKKSISDLRNFPRKTFHLFRGYFILRRLKFAGVMNIRIFISFYKMRKNYEIIHIHLARDLVTLPIAYMCKILKLSYVLQCHGMIDPSSRLSALILDRIATRTVLRNSLLVLSLSDEEDRDLLEVENKIKIERFINAAKPGPQSHREDRIIFVGRLGEDKRPENLVRAGQLLLQQGYNLIFDFIGPDAGRLDVCKEIIMQSQFSDSFIFHGSLSNLEAVTFLSRSQILVLPSPRDRFPLAVVESLSTGTPVIISSGNGLASIINAYNAGIVCDVSPASIASSIVTILEKRHNYQENASILFNEVFNLAINTSTLLNYYQKGLN